MYIYFSFFLIYLWSIMSRPLYRRDGHMLKPLSCSINAGRTVCTPDHSCQKVHAKVDESWKGTCRSKIHPQVGTGQSRAVSALECGCKGVFMIVVKGQRKRGAGQEGWAVWKWQEVKQGSLPSL